MNLFYDKSDGDLALQKMAAIYQVGKIVILAASGLIGATLTGLALHAGRSLPARKN